MGKWKPKPAPRMPVGRVLANAPEHEAAARANVREAIGEDREIRPTPAWQVPISAIVTELVTPHRMSLPDPNDPVGLSALANLATMAWNVSRLLRGDDAAVAAEAASAWSRVEASEPGGGMIARAMLAHARTLHPADDRIILRSDVVMKNGQPFIHATSSPGAAGMRPPEARP
ncbi:MAG: hypothetical protein ACOZNI_18370 [Myxococcota bacterium]